MASAPQVLSTTPVNYQTGIDPNAPITATFNIDLDSRYISDYVYLTDSLGNRVSGQTSYTRMVLTFTPDAPLMSGKTYQFFLIGDSDTTGSQVVGLRNIVGDPMVGNVVVTFTTDSTAAITPPAPLSPADGSMINTTPTFQWAESDGAFSYEIRVSKSNRFDVLVYPVTDFDQMILETEVTPAIPWDDGIYYWQVRAVRSDGATSDWSPIRQFNLMTQEEGKVVEEDAPMPEVTYDVADDSVELIETYPPTDAIAIDVKTKTIYFRLLGTIDVTKIDLDSFIVYGANISGVTDPNAPTANPSHGVVKGKTTIVQASDGTTYIVFTPELQPQELPKMTLTFNPGVLGLTESDFIVRDTNDTPIEVIYAVSNTDGTSYDLSGYFLSTDYTISVNKANYQINDMQVSMPKPKLTVVAGTAVGTLLQ